jgi:hypothetical protein
VKKKPFRWTTWRKSLRRLIEIEGLECAKDYVIDVLYQEALRHPAKYRARLKDLGMVFVNELWEVHEMMRKRGGKSDGAQ